MYVSANINIKMQPSLSHPRCAVIKNGDKYFVYIQGEYQSQVKKQKLTNKEGEAHSEARLLARRRTQRSTFQKHRSFHQEQIDLGYTEVIC
jgi:cobalt-zinc-cadmium efflux system membrane fusion protein